MLYILWFTIPSRLIFQTDCKGGWVAFTVISNFLPMSMLGSLFTHCLVSEVFVKSKQFKLIIYFGEMLLKIYSDPLSSLVVRGSDHSILAESALCKLHMGKIGLHESISTVR
jgi:hypothetical protein